VVRSTHQGESHGGVYLVDLEDGASEQVLDWSDAGISWEGRGGDRGLRGIAFHGSQVYLAASDEIFVFDPGFRRLGSFRNPYLKHCHEIFVRGDRLFATSTGFDAVLEFDLPAARFVRGYQLRFSAVWRARRRFELHPRPRLTIFEQLREDDVEAGDTCHVNSVTADERGIHLCGTALGDLWTIRDGRLHRFAKITYGSHNARPYREGVLLNHTRTDRVAYLNLHGRVVRSWPVHRFGADELEHAGLSEDLARQAFGRGLAILDDDLFVAGSSPATVTVYDFGADEPVSQVTLTRDVRNAVHGLERWPFS
jgi:hypothetical protein